MDGEGQRKTHIMLWRIHESDRSGLRTYRQSYGRPALPSLFFLMLGAASVSSRFINHTQSTSKLNRRGCHTVFLPFLKVFFIHRLTPLSQSFCLSLLINLQFLACSISSFFSLSLSLFLAVEESLWCQLLYINNCKVWKTPAKNGQTPSIFPCVVHWLMSGAGHCMSRHRKCALSCLSCQYCTSHTKCQTQLSFTLTCHLN